MKARRHHNNKGYRQIQRGKTRDQVEAMAKRLKLTYAPVVQRPERGAHNALDAGSNPAGRTKLEQEQ